MSPAPGSPGDPGSSLEGSGQDSRGLWLTIAAAVVSVGVVVAVVVVALAAGDDADAPRAGATSFGAEEGPSVDVSTEAIDRRYDVLATRITAGATDCTALDGGAAEREVVECALDGGTLRLVTYASTDELDSVRAARLDNRAGTLSSDNGSTALYSFDPDRAGTSDPALIYWDSLSGPQSATITGGRGTDLQALDALYTSTSPRVSRPVNPQHPLLREFIDINMRVSGCTRRHTLLAGETEESTCKVDVKRIKVTVGRYATKKALRKARAFYQRKYDRADVKGVGPTWTFGEGSPEGAYFSFLDNGGDTATAYWDWDEGDCHCYAVASHSGGDLPGLDEWWPSDD